MASMLTKVELLQAVGAADLADQALTKVMHIEIKRLQQEQQRLLTELARFESIYQMTSATCQHKFERGELGDAVELFEWTSLYAIYEQNAHTLRRLEEQVQ